MKSVLNIDWNDCCWNWSSSTLTTWCEELTLLKRPWCWEIMKAVGERDDRKWDGWMASPPCRSWVWASPRRWWWTWKPGVLQSMGSQRFRHDWATELMYNTDSPSENKVCMLSDGWTSDDILWSMLIFQSFHIFKFISISASYLPLCFKNYSECYGY